MATYIDFRNKIEYDKLKEVANCLKQGGIAIFPTETVYGIGAVSSNADAVKKIYEVKQRPLEKALSVLVSSIKMAESVALEISKEERAVMEKFFPGPLTLILKKSDNISKFVTAGKNTVGIRMPENEIALRLIEEVGMPLATPSANISGKPSGIELLEIMKDFEGKVDYFIDGGKSKLAVSSTVAQIIDGKVNILRQGIITKEDIEKVLEEVK